MSAPPPQAAEPAGQDPQADPEEVFAAFLASRQAGAPADVEALLREHPALAPRLEQLIRDWSRVEGVLARLGVTQSLSERVAALFGDVDPGVSLSGDEAPPTSSGRARERLERLALHSAPETRYQTHGEIGRGGMGVVLRVWDRDLRRPLAMKTALGRREVYDPASKAERAELDPHRLARFLEEAQVTGQLDHPCIVPVHELGVDLHGRVYFTMRLVRGVSFRQVVEYVHHPELALEDNVGDTWTLARALGVLLRVAEAMSYAHSKGVVHRDLKPANVMVGRFGETYVMDWGLAKVKGRRDSRNLRIAEGSKSSQSDIHTDRLDEDAEAPILTMDGDVVGTPAYLSPEQARGRVEEIGEAADVYGLGAMLYHLLAGERPYTPRGERDSPQRVLEAVRRGPPAALREIAPEVSPELVAICERAMARRPAERYPDMRELARDLRSHLEGRVVGAYEAGALAELKKWVARNKGLAAASAAALIATVLGLAAVGWVEARGRRAAAAALAELEEYTEARWAQTLLERGYRDLWPALPERAPDYEAWLAEARRLAARRAHYEAELAAVEARALAPTELDLAFEAKQKAPLAKELEQHAQRLAALATLLASRPEPLPSWVAEHAAAQAAHDAAEARLAERTFWRFASPRDDLRRDLLHDLVASLADLPASIENVAARLETARTLEERTLSGPEAARRWSAARADVAGRPIYAGLALEPRLGLLPLWCNPQSGLWEFLWVPSGAEPELEPESGRVLGDESSGIVLVLVPAGRFRLGCELPYGERGLGAPNVDPGCRPAFFETPPQDVSLDAFFIAKHEVTQAQWQRASGENPSQYAPGQPVLDDPQAYTLAHPVERVSWEDARVFAERLGLELPTEARWEYAARAGTTSVFWTGADAASLAGRENVADLDLAELDPSYSIALGNVEPFADGFARTAPVASFEPNPFGLHDVHGNVHEWCRDYDFTAASPVRDGDGFREQPDTPFRLVKGGSWVQRAANARSAFHAGIPPDERWESIGLRPVLGLGPAR